MTLTQQHSITLSMTDIDQTAILRHLGINANDPAAQALILVCQKYDLDPILKHALLIQGRLYVTRDGLLHVAHRSGKFDGMEVVEQGENATHFTAKVSVYRKDMGRPFTYIGRHPKGVRGPGAQYGPEMAVKVAEVMALRRAFDVALGAAEERWDEEAQREMQQADTPPPAQERQEDPALKFWVDKTHAMRARVVKAFPESAGTITELLESLPGWENSLDTARGMYESVRDYGLELNEKKAAPVNSDTEVMATQEQVQQLAGHARSAGCTTSEDRAALYAYLMPSVTGSTKTLTEQQAEFLLDTLSGMAPEERQQAWSEAKKAKKGVLL